MMKTNHPPHHHLHPQGRSLFVVVPLPSKTHYNVLFYAPLKLIPLPSSSIGSSSSSEDVQPLDCPIVFLLEEATSFKADRNSSASIASAIQSLKPCPTGDKDPFDRSSPLDDQSSAKMSTLRAQFVRFKNHFPHFCPSCFSTRIHPHDGHLHSLLHGDHILRLLHFFCSLRFLLRILHRRLHRFGVIGLRLR